MVREHVQKLRTIFERQIGIRLDTRSTIPQWRYNLKHKEPVDDSLPDTA